MQAYVVELPSIADGESLLKYVESKHAQGKAADPEHYKLIQESAAAYRDGPDANCVESQMTFEERTSGASAGYRIVQNLMMMCVHPRNQNVGVYVLYQDIHDPEKQEPDFLVKGRGVFNSVQFTEL